MSADERSRAGAGPHSPRPAGSDVSVAAIVLAAGTSSRWRGPGSKQLHPWRGEALARRIARIAAESEASEVLVVTGHDADGVERALAGLAVRVVHNPRYASGQASSVRAGIAAIAPDADGALFVPCDQPLLDAATLDLLIARFRALPSSHRRGRALVPAFRGRRGAPALIGREILARFSVLEGDEGGRRVLAAIPDRVLEVELPSSDPLVDVDTLADLRALEGTAEAATSSSRPVAASLGGGRPRPRTDDPVGGKAPSPHDSRSRRTRSRPPTAISFPPMPGRSPSSTHDARPPLPGLLPLRGVVRRYDWGSHTFLAGLRSQPEPSVEPEAELWFGAHPSAPSMVLLGDRELSLDELIAERAGDLLGAESVDAGAELPFLLKILAADLPLSIQLHPDAERARAGFEREEGEGIARRAPHRLYPDANPKPEIACALTPFHALQGLRPPAEARDLLASLGCPEASALLEAGDLAEPAALLAAVLALSGEEARAFATAVAAAARRVASREAAWVVRLEETYPGDPLIVAPLLLRLVELAPGEALYTPPGVIHSYLGGAIVELMGSSDNVLRAGLTSKHRDRDELLAALDGAPRDPRILLPRALAGSAWREYPETGPLRLSFADVDPAAPVEVEAAAGPYVLLALSGDVVARSADGAEVRLLPGDAALVPASTPACRLDGAGRIYRASAAAG